MQRRVSLVLLLLAGIAAFIFVSCKKMESSSIPVIELMSPVENTSYSLPDSIHVQAKISDSRSIKSILIQLVTEDFIPVLPAIYIYPDATEKSLDFYYPLEGSTGLSGNYYLQIKAENATQFRNKYQPLSVTGNFFGTARLLVIEASSDNHLQVSGMEVNGEVNWLFDVSGDYCDAAIDNHSQLLFIAGKNDLNIAAMDITTGEERWRLPNIEYKPMHNDHCLNFYLNTLYASFNYQHLYGYNITGMITFDAPIAENDAPAGIFRHGDYVLVDVQKKNNSQPLIRTHYALTGNEKQSYLNWMQVVEFFSYSNDSVIVCANEGSGSKVFFYNVEANSHSDLFSFESTMRCVAAINSYQLIIGLENSLYEVNLNTGSAVKLQQGLSYSLVRYETLSGLLYLVLENQLVIYRYPEMEYQKTVTFSDTILDVLLNYSL